MSQVFSIWGDKETIQQNPGDLYMKAQAISREKALSQVLGQWYFHHTNCQLTEKVSGRLFPNSYQENRLLMTHLFVYENIFVMILRTVPQSFRTLCELTGLKPPQPGFLPKYLKLFRFVPDEK